MPLGEPGFAGKLLPLSARIEGPGDLAKIRERWESLVMVLVGRGVCLGSLHELEIDVHANG